MDDIFAGPGRLLNQIPEPSVPELTQEEAGFVQPEITPQLKLELLLDQTHKLRGTSFSGYPFHELQPGQRLEAQLDPYGKTVNRGGHPDPLAVSICDEHRRHIGYLSKQRAPDIYVALSKGATLEVSILPGNQGIVGGYQQKNYGVNVRLTLYGPTSILAVTDTELAKG